MAKYMLVLRTAIVLGFRLQVDQAKVPNSAKLGLLSQILTGN